MRFKVWALTTLAAGAAVIAYALSFVFRGRGDPLARERAADEAERRRVQDLEAEGRRLTAAAEEEKTKPLPGAMTEAAADEALRKKGWLR